MSPGKEAMADRVKRDKQDHQFNRTSDNKILNGYFFYTSFIKYNLSPGLPLLTQPTFLCKTILQFLANKELPSKRK